MQETHKTQVRPLDWEDPLEEEMATRCNILPWEIPWIAYGVHKRVRHNLATQQQQN